MKHSLGKLLMASPLLALPLFLVPAFCFALNRISFVWSLAAAGFTVWRLRRAQLDETGSTTPVRGAVPQLVGATVVLQMLVFAWIGAVWMLQGAGQLVMLSKPAGELVGWIQTHWFADIAAWLVLFGIVCGLFRLGRPLLAWHERAILSAARVLS